MATNLVSLSQDALGRDFSKFAGQFLGESPGATQTALGSLVPAVLGGIARQGSTPEGATNLLSLINGGGASVSSAGSLAKLFDDDPNRVNELQRLGSTKLVPAVFGDKASDLATAVSSASGIKASSAAGLMAMVVPAVLAFVKRFAGEKGLNANSLSSLLASQGPNLQGTLDSRITNALGFSSPAAFVGGLGDRTAETVKRVETTAPAEAYKATSARPAAARGTLTEKRNQWGWLPWAIGAALLLGLAAMFLGNPTAPPTEVAETAAPVTPPVSTAPTVTAPPVATPPPAAAVAFPASIYFDTGSNAIPGVDASTINGVADAVASGDFRIALTGYTDRTGDAAANEELAMNRATAVRDALIAAGVPEASIEMRAPVFVEAGAGGASAEARRVDISRL